MARKRIYSLYCTIISEGPLMIVRLPNNATPWRPLITKLMGRLKIDHGLLGRQIHGLEGLAGAPEGDEEPDPIFLSRIEQAYEGAADILPKFLLYDWDGEKQNFFLLRGKST